MENQQQQPQNTPLCRGNCGFYGSPATEDLCSKCFKDMIQRKQETGTNVPAQRHSPTLTQADNTDGTTSASTSITTELMTEKTSNNGNSGTHQCDQQLDSSSHEVAVQTNDSVELKSGTNAIAAEETETASESSLSLPLKKPKNRCQVCNKRVGLTGFECRCGGLYCGEHRYDTAHNCTFDYKTSGREQLRKSNPQVVSEKIQRI